MINEVFKISKEAPFRSHYQVLSKLMEEVGELSKEINIEYKYIDKPQGKDGIIGEAIDIIVCALDIIFLENKEITEKELIAIIKNKLNKWKNSF